MYCIISKYTYAHFIYYKVYKIISWRRGNLALLIIEPKYSLDEGKTVYNKKITRQPKYCSDIFLNN